MELAGTRADRDLFHRWWHSRLGGALARELLLVLGLLAFYKYGRFLVRDQAQSAFDHARELIARRARAEHLQRSPAAGAGVGTWRHRAPGAQRLLPLRPRRGDRGGVLLAVRAPPARVRAIPSRDDPDDARRAGPAPARSLGAAAHVPASRFRRHRCDLRPCFVRERQRVQGVRQRIRGVAVAALRVGARGRPGPPSSRCAAGGVSWCSSTPYSPSPPSSSPRTTTGSTRSRRRHCSWRGSRPTTCCGGDRHARGRGGKPTSAAHAAGSAPGAGRQRCGDAIARAAPRGSDREPAWNRTSPGTTDT